MWGNHGDWMWGMGGLMGLGWIFILIVIAVPVWLLVRGPLAGGAQTERRVLWTFSRSAMRAAISAARSSSRRSAISRLDAAAHQPARLKETVDGV